MKNHRKLNILITGVGGPTPRSFARAIKQIGNYKPYNLYATDIHKYAVGLYQTDLFEKSFITPRSSEPEYWNVMEKIIRDYCIDIAVILPELEVIAWSKRQENAELPCKSLIPDRAAAELMWDKSALSDVLSPHGLVPETMDINADDPDLKEKINLKLEYPFWIRSSTGTSGLGSYLVKDFDDLKMWIALNRGIRQFIGSTYLPGRNLGCKMLYYKGKLLRAAVGERVHYIMAKTAPSGVTGNSGFGRLLNAPEVFDTSLKSIEILFEFTKSRKHGFFTVDLKEDANGKPYVTEVNLRHVAFTSSFAAGGANLCEDQIRVLDGDPEFDPDFKLYEFEDGLIFLRDVDAMPIVMNEKDLLK